MIFGEDTEGKASVIVAPLVRLTNKKDAKIEDIGKPADVLSSVGPFITGSYLDAEDVQSIRTVTQDDGLTCAAACDHAHASEHFESRTGFSCAAYAGSASHLCPVSVGLPRT